MKTPNKEKKTFAFYVHLEVANHPSCQPLDLIKLAYQNAFGGEHLLSDPLLAQKYFNREWEETEPNDGPLYEEISPTLSRLNIGPLKKAGFRKEALFKIFAESALKFGNTDKKSFESNLRTIAMMARKKDLPFTLETWTAALTTYKKGGLHPVHHSPEYSLHEKPHYRLGLTALFWKEFKKLLFI
jgi:hypothetical protein